MKNSEVEQEQTEMQERFNKEILKRGHPVENFKMVAVGYLDITEKYEKGVVSGYFISKLNQIWKSGMTLGSLGHHDCEFCIDEGNYEGRATSSSEKVLKDNINKIEYKFPEMIFHYIEKHKFKPSDEFIRFVMNYNIESQGINISQVFDEALAKLTDKNITDICKKRK